MKSGANRAPNLVGRIERATVKTGEHGTQVLAIEGWLFDASEPLVALQMGVPGSQLVLVVRDSGEKLKNPALDDHKDKLPGFQAEIPLPAVGNTSLVHFLATLADGVTIAGGLPLPDEILRVADDSQKSSKLEYAELLKNHARLLQSKMLAFLQTANTLEFQLSEKPDLSIIIPVFNKPEFLLDCLWSLRQQAGVNYEIIIVDNASAVQTKDLYQKLRGVCLIENLENKHFINACNQGADRARADYLLFLNSDTWLYPDALVNALKYMQEHSEIGAVGARQIGIDGFLQEAGSYILPDASTGGYARGKHFEAPEAMFQRPVDYCSAAFLLTPRDIFLKLGKFDTYYYPAYYEDADYCTRLWQQRLQTVYLPEVVIQHAENASAIGDFARTHQLVNREKFRLRFEQRLRERIGKRNVHAYRYAMERRKNKSVLVLDDQLPAAEKGSGFPRQQLMLRELENLGCNVTFFPMLVGPEDWTTIYKHLPRSVEVIKDYGEERLKEFLRERLGCFQCLLVSRPQNMQVVSDLMTAAPELFDGLEVVFDAEAISALREIGKLTWQQGLSISSAEQEYIIKREIEVCTKATKIICVSNREAALYRQYSSQPVSVLSYAITKKPSHMPVLSDRHNILSLGPLLDRDTPNASGLLWFKDQVWPYVSQKLPQARFVHVGKNTCELFKSDLPANFCLVGPQSELDDEFGKARIFVAPQQYSAGIPLKCLEAISFGVPCVVSQHIANQLGWQPEQPALVAQSAEDFAEQIIRLMTDDQLWQSLSLAGLQLLDTEYSLENFRSRLDKIINQEKSLMQEYRPLNSSQALS